MTADRNTAKIKPNIENDSVSNNQSIKFNVNFKKMSKQNLCNCPTLRSDSHNLRNYDSVSNISNYSLHPRGMLDRDQRSVKSKLNHPLTSVCSQKCVKNMCYSSHSEINLKNKVPSVKYYKVLDKNIINRSNYRHRISQRKCL